VVVVVVDVDVVVVGCVVVVVVLGWVVVVVDVVVVGCVVVVDELVVVVVVPRCRVLETLSRSPVVIVVCKASHSRAATTGCALDPRADDGGASTRSSVPMPVSAVPPTPRNDLVRARSRPPGRRAAKPAGGRMAQRRRMAFSTVDAAGHCNNAATIAYCPWSRFDAVNLAAMGRKSNVFGHFGGLDPPHGPASPTF